MTPKRLEQLRQMLQESRARLLLSAPRFADPLRDMLFVAVRDAERMSTNGRAVFFDPDWLQKLSGEALDFMLSHQLMHISLGHIRRPALYRGGRYHLACDVVANSMLRQAGWTKEKLPGVGVIHHTTFFPREEGYALTPEEAFSMIPFDPSALSQAEKRRYLIDSEEYWDRPEAGAEAGELVLSPECREAASAAPESVPQADRRSGRSRAHGEEEDAEERLYILDSIRDFAEAAEQRNQRGSSPETRQTKSWEASQKERLKTVRAERAYTAQRAQEIFPGARVWQRTNRVCLDWRRLLDAFLQEEICDYSFLPPDRRYQSEDFFLPDFNDALQQPLKVLFMVDTSGSVSDEQLAAVFTEISSAIEQFNGRLTGLLGFFDTRTYRPVPFASVGDVRRIQPYGGGGTNYRCIFQDCRTYFGDEKLASLIVITDGKAEFPPEEEAMGIPTLWLLTNDRAGVPWGRYAVLSTD